jgi:uncharacterized membrane protein YphA (DoxX/SURF4 family)
MARALAYIAGVVLIVAGVAMLLRWKARLASLILGGIILLDFLIFYVPQDVLF